MNHEASLREFIKGFWKGFNDLKHNDTGGRTADGELHQSSVPSLPLCFKEISPKIFRNGFYPSASLECVAPRTSIKCSKKMARQRRTEVHRTDDWLRFSSLVHFIWQTGSSAGIHPADASHDKIRQCPKAHRSESSPEISPLVRVDCWGLSPITETREIFSIDFKRS